MIAEGEAESEKLGGTLIASVIVMDAVKLPEDPLMVIVAVPVAAVALAANVSRLEPVVGFVPQEAVTPLGRLAAARVAAPVNPPTSVTEMMLVPLLPSVTATVDGDAASVKLGGTFTVSASAVDAIRLPEVPVIVTVAGPAAAELLAVNVTRLEPLVGFVPHVAVTPLGRFVAARVTAPVNTPASMTEIVLLPLAP